MTRKSQRNAEEFSESNSSMSTDRNLFWTSEQRSCIVLNQPREGREQAKEPQETEKESTAMDSFDLGVADAAASEKLGEYLRHIAHLDMPLSAKIEMVSTMRQIMASFVDSAFGDDPVQHVHEMHARDEKRIPAVVSSGNTSKNTKARLSSAFASPARGKRKERP